MANKSEQSVNSTQDPLCLSLGSYTENIKFVVNPLSYDLILGKKWQNNHHAIVDCVNNEVHFCYRGKQYSLSGEKPRVHDEVSVNAICKDLETGSPMIAVYVRDKNDKNKVPKYHPEERTILDN